MSVSLQEKPMADACHGCQIRDQTLCRDLDPSVLVRLRSGIRVLAPGVDLVSQGDCCENLYVISDGWISLYELMEDGRKQILQFALSGDVVGFQLDGGASIFGAQALTAVAACVIPRTRFLQAARRHPDLALRLSGMIARDEAMAYVHLTSLGRRTALERVAYLLLELFCRARARLPVVRGDSISLPLTQSHIADALGLTPVHTNRMLRDLRESGIIDLNQRTLRVLDPDRLAGAAGFEREVGLPWLQHH